MPILLMTLSSFPFHQPPTFQHWLISVWNNRQYEYPICPKAEIFAPNPNESENTVESRLNDCACSSPLK